MSNNLLRLTVSVIIPEEERFWYVRTAKDGLWGLPAGKIESEPYEPAERTAIREAYEELGVGIVLEKIIGCYQFISSMSHPVFNIVYAASIIDRIPHIINPGEILEIKKYSIEEVRDIMKRGQLRAGEANMRCVEDYLKGLNYPLKTIAYL